MFAMDRVKLIGNFVWHYNCQAGAKCLGVWSHIASISWYLGYAKHKPDKSSHVVNDTDSDEGVIEE